MPSQKPRLARLTAILTSLQSSSMVTARELADKYEVSIRTIYRDVQTLLQSGVPIITEEGRGYTLLSGYRLPPVMFSQAEASALVTAAALIRQQGDSSLQKHYEQAVSKIKAVMRPSQLQQAELLQNRIVVRSPGMLKAKSEHLIQLQLAIANAQLVKLDYLSLSGQASQRTIEPFAFYGNNQHWILIAFCRLRQAFRSFRLDQIQQLQVLNEHFIAQTISLSDFFRAEAEKKYPTPDIPLTAATSNFATNQIQRLMSVTQIPPFNIIGISVRTANADGQASRDLSQLWGRFFSEQIQEKIPGKTERTIYCAYTNFENDHNAPYDAILGCKVDSLDQIPEGMVGQVLNIGAAKKIAVKGDIRQGQAVADAWGDIWNADINRSFTTDLEVYDERAMDPANAEVDIYIAVK